MRYFKQITALHRFSFKITRQAAGHVVQQLAKQQLKNLKLFKFISMVVLQSLLVFLYNPMKSFFVNRELLSLLPIDIVFTDQTQLSGFLLANLIMAAMGVYLISVSLFVSLNFYAIIVNCSIQVDLIEIDIKQLDTFWSNTSTTSLLQRHLFLRNICQKCQDKDE